MPAQTNGADSRPGNMPGGGSLVAVSKMLTRLAMAMLFFGLLTPIAVVTRFAGRDRLRLRRNHWQGSYWVIRTAPDGRQAAMTRQI